MISVVNINDIYDNQKPSKQTLAEFIRTSFKSFHQNSLELVSKVLSHQFELIMQISCCLMHEFRV